MDVRKRPFLISTLAIFTLVLAVACGSSGSGDDPTATSESATASDPTPTGTIGSTQTPTSTPQPTATATSKPGTVNGYITIDPDEDPDGFIAALPQSEVECAANVVGGRQVFRDLVASEDPIGTTLSDATAEELSGCVSNETVKNVMVGGLIAKAGDLSDSTIDCIERNVPDVGFSSVVRGVDVSGSDLIQAIEALFCMSEDERLAFEQANPTDEGESTVGLINAFECVSDTAGMDGLAAFESLGNSEGTPDFALLGEFMPILNDCGMFDLSGFDDSPISADQLTCLFTEVDPEVLNSIVNADESAEPDLAALGIVLLAFQTCEIDLEELTSDTRV